MTDMPFPYHPPPPFGTLFLGVLGLVLFVIVWWLLFDIITWFLHFCGVGGTLSAFHACLLHTLHLPSPLAFPGTGTGSGQRLGLVGPTIACTICVVNRQTGRQAVWHDTLLPLAPLHAPLHTHTSPRTSHHPPAPTPYRPTTPASQAFCPDFPHLPPPSPYTVCGTMPPMTMTMTACVIFILVLLPATQVYPHTCHTPCPNPLAPTTPAWLLPTNPSAGTYYYCLPAPPHPHMLCRLCILLPQTSRHEKAGSMCLYPQYHLPHPNARKKSHLLGSTSQAACLCAILPSPSVALPSLPAFLFAWASFLPHSPFSAEKHAFCIPSSASSQHFSFMEHGTGGVCLCRALGRAWAFMVVGRVGHFGQW